jgi:predicted RNase H-like HicB family nuclease
MELTVAIHAEGDSYWSEVRELPGCFASGRTLEELAEALEEAVGMCLDDPATTLVQPRLHVGTSSCPRSLGCECLSGSRHPEPSCANLI